MKEWAAIVLLIIGAACVLYNFFLSFIFLVIGLCWSYFMAGGNQLRILDLALTCFVVCMIPVYIILGLSIYFWMPLLFAALIARILITWWIHDRSEIRKVDLIILGSICLAVASTFPLVSDLGLPATYLSLLVIREHVRLSVFVSIPCFIVAIVTALLRSEH